MKKILCVLVAIGFVFGLFTVGAFAKTKKTKPAEESAKKEVRPSDKKAKEITAKKRAELANTAWNIEIAAPGKEGAQKLADLIFFKDNQFSSQEFSKKGFVPTNYSLTVGDDGAIVFETMQTSEKAGTVFWRGEFREQNTLKGMLSEVSSDQKATDYSFAGSKNLTGAGQEVVVESTPSAKVQEKKEKDK
jgi:hypothetical protein